MFFFAKTLPHGVTKHMSEGALTYQLEGMGQKGTEVSCFSKWISKGRPYEATPLLQANDGKGVQDWRCSMLLYYCYITAEAGFQIMKDYKSRFRSNSADV